MTRGADGENAFTDRISYSALPKFKKPTIENNHILRISYMDERAHSGRRRAYRDKHPPRKP
jgi:hypothetical protein